MSRHRSGDLVPNSDWPPTAEALMRSRFVAFRDGDAHWLRESWHPSTRPAEVDLRDNPRWRGLQIVDTIDGGDAGTADETGIVEFRATYVTAAGVQVMHGRSCFVRQDGRWYYLNGEAL